MKNGFKIAFIIFLFCSGAVTKGYGKSRPALTITQDTTIPHLVRRGKAVQLIVDGKPYLVLGGELHNSSSSSLKYMEPYWSKLAKAHLNTVLAAVSWELIEPQEGKFDFHLVDGMIRQARKNHLHLILLWFGSWKNGQSYYTPAWVKRDEKRFPLVRIKSGHHIDILSPFSRNTLKADAGAFAALMRHIKQIDGAQHTVIMMQVENEVGVLGDSRDRSRLANEYFQKKVPAQLMRYLQTHKNNLRKNIYDLWGKNGFKTSGNWTDIFGAGTATDELFMAWQYAHYIDLVAKAGKAEYPLPMYVNAWIVQPGDKDPGDYPSGGPQAHVHDIWKAAAPNIDILAPDIYLNGFPKITAQYEEPDKGFFIPESFSGKTGAANAFYAFGACKTIGYSPFGIDGVVRNSTDGPVSKAYDVLAQLQPLLLKAQEEGTITAVSLNKEHPEQKVHMGNYVLDVARRHPWRRDKVAKTGYALIISTAPDEYYVAGNDIQITFYPGSGSGLVGYDYVEDGMFQDGKWQAGRRLNGDAITSSLKLAKMAAQGKTGTMVSIGDGPSVRKVKVYQFR